MEYREFAAPYNPAQPLSTVHQEASSHLNGLTQTGHMLGRILHGYLMGESLSLENAHQTVTDYTRVYGSYYPAIDRLRQADSIIDHKSAWRATAGNFYTLTGAMMSAWLPVLYDELDVPREDRLHGINVSQARLALEGLGVAYSLKTLSSTPDEHYQHPENYSTDITRQRTPYMMFSANYEPLRSWLVGYGNEVDAAIILLEVMKQRPNLTVVPAPPQFEAGPARHNVDFIALDTAEREAVGIQVKSSIYDAGKLERYDRDKIVFIDGQTDLDNTKAVRRGPYRSETRSVSWPGLISLEHFDRLKTYGKDAQTIAAFGYSPQLVMRWKMHVKQKLGKLPKRIPIATQRIRQRIDAAMKTERDLAS